MRIMPSQQGVDRQSKREEGEEGKLGAGCWVQALALALAPRHSVPVAQVHLGSWGQDQAEVSVHQLTLVSVVRPPCLVVLAWPAIGTQQKSVRSPRQARRSMRKDGSCLLDDLLVFAVRRSCS